MAQYSRHNSNQNRQNRSSQPDPMHGVLESVFKGIWAIISFPFRGKGSAKQREIEAAKAEFRATWSTLEASLHDSVNRTQAIMKADILLDRALRIHNISGTTLGERLKAAATKLDRDVLDAAWRAHKVRNRLAHELNAELSEREAQQTMNDFRLVLKRLGLL